MTKAQEVYERVEVLVGSGIKKAEAFKQVADEFGQPINSMRGAYYSHSRSMGDSSGRPARVRKRETTTADAVESAAMLLRRAIDAIDAEVEAAKERIEEAKAEYEHLRETAAAKKEAIEAKLEALQA